MLRQIIRSWSPKARYVAAVAGLLAIASGAVWLGQDGDDAAPSAEPTTTEVRAEPPRFSRQPLWTNRNGQVMSSIFEAQFRGDLAILSGESRRGRELAVVDAETGHVRWRAVEFDTLDQGGDAFLWSSEEPEIIGDKNGWSLLVAYGTSRDERGVAALSSTDGHVLWKVPVVPAAERPRDLASADPSIDLVGADEDLAVVSTSEDAVDGDAHRTTVVDLSTRRPRWSRPGVWPLEINEGIVLAQRSGVNPLETLAPGYQRGDVVALDATTGVPRWDMATRYPSTALTLTAGDVTLVRAGEWPDDTSPVVLETSSGRELAEFDDPDGFCVGDGRALILCPIQVDDTIEVQAYHVDERTIEQYEWPESQPIDVVWRDYVFDLTNDQVLDLEGDALVESLPGSLLAVSDHYAMFNFRPPDSSPRLFSWSYLYRVTLPGS